MSVQNHIPTTCFKKTPRGETYFDMVCTSPLVPCHSAPVVRQEFESAFSSSSQEPLPLYFHLAHRRARRRDSILYICRWLQALHIWFQSISLFVLVYYFVNCWCRSFCSYVWCTTFSFNLCHFLPFLTRFLHISTEERMHNWILVAKVKKIIHIFWLRRQINLS